MYLNYSYFRFDGNRYKQADGLETGLCLPPVIANIFLDAFWDKFAQKAPN